MFFMHSRIFFRFFFTSSPLSFGRDDAVLSSNSHIMTCGRNSLCSCSLIGQQSSERCLWCSDGFCALCCHLKRICPNHGLNDHYVFLPNRYSTYLYCLSCVHGQARFEDKKQENFFNFTLSLQIRFGTQGCSFIYLFKYCHVVMDKLSLWGEFGALL